jgi:hypothetical protein
MNRKQLTINLLLLFLLAATLAVPAARAQVTDDLEKLREYIQQNQELLAEAESLVRGTNSAKARASLDAARQLHLASIREANALRPTISAQSAKQARNAILKAIQLAKRETKLEERALKAIEHAGRRNERARAVYDETGGNDGLPAKKLIDESTDQMLRARGSMREHMFEVAIQSANASTDMSDRAIRLLRRADIGPEAVRREIARTDLLLDRIDERADRSVNGNIGRMITEAHDLQNRARADAAEGRYLIAFENTKRARTIARRIINQAGGSPGATAEGVARAIELTAGLIDRAYEIARENGDNRAVQRIDEANRLQRDAGAAYNAGQLDRAYSLTQRAREITRETMQGTDRPVDRGSVRTALERTDQVLGRLRSALDTNANETAAGMYTRAAARQAASWEAFNDGDLKKALTNTKVARNLANNALQQLENE